MSCELFHLKVICASLTDCSKHTSCVLGHRGVHDHSRSVESSDEFLRHVSDLVCFAPEDHPNNEFFDKVLPFLPTDVRGAFQLYKSSCIVEKHCFSDTSHQGMDGEWHSSIAIAVSNNPTNLVTIQDSSNYDPLDISQVSKLCFIEFKSRLQGLLLRF